jgi:uncharacterized protein YcaQ
VKSLHLEPDAPLSDSLAANLAAALTAFARWHKTPEIVLRDSAPPEFGDALRAALPFVRIAD